MAAIWGTTVGGPHGSPVHFLKREKGRSMLAAVLLLICGYPVARGVQTSPLLTCGFILALPVLASMLLHPQVGLVLMVAFLPFQRSILGNYGLALSWMPLFPLLLLTVLNVRNGFDAIRLRDYLPQLFHIVLWGYLAVSFCAQYVFSLSEPYGANPLGRAGVVHFPYILQGFVLFWIFSVLVNTRSRLKIVVVSLAGLFGVLVLLGTYEVVADMAGQRNPFMEFWRVAGLEPVLEGTWQPHLTALFFRSWTGGAQFGTFLVSSGFILSPVLFYRARGPKRKIAVVALLALSLFCLRYTYSVGNWIGFVAGLPVLIWLLGKQKRVVSLIMIMGCVIAVGAIYSDPSIPRVFVSLLPSQAQQKVLDVINMIVALEDPMSGSMIIRLRLVEAGLQMFRESPFWGIGFGAYGNYMISSGLINWTIAWYPHNSYIYILGELGLVGILLFVFFIGTTVKSAVTNLRALEDPSLRYLQIGLISALISHLVFLINYETWLYEINFWFTIGLTVAVSNVVRRQHADEAR